GFNSGDYAARVAGSAAIGCGSSVASGGSCGSGALSGAVGSALAPLTNTVFPHAQTDFGERIGATIIQASVRGLASVAGGGKFADGAVTGAFQYLATTSLEDARRDAMNANACLEDACVAEIAGGTALANWLSGVLGGATAAAGAYAIGRTTTNSDD